MDHDQLFKTMLKTFLPELFELFFPEWAARFDFSTVEWLEQEVFPDPPDGRRHSLDLVAKLRERETAEPVDRAAGTGGEGGEWLSIIHIEVESADSVAPLRRRMFRYYVHLRDKHDLPVLPLAIYLRVGLDGIGVDAYEERYGSLELIRFHYLYVGLPALDAVEYLESGNDLAAGLAALMRIPRDRRMRLMGDALLRVRHAPRTEQEKFLLAECIQAYLRPETPDESRELETLLASEQYEEVKAMAVTWYEQGLEQGREQGRELGLEALTLLLEDRFGVLAPEVIAQLESLPLDRMRELLRRVPQAESLQDLGLGVDVPAQ